MRTYFDLSVHQLVDFLLREGDIDSRVYNTTTMTQGVAIHQYYQKLQNDTYTPEVALQGTIVLNGYTFFLHGRCDGLILNNGDVTIDEIKSTNQDLDEFHAINKDWHLGQAICYAYLYALENKKKKIDITLTYISQKTKETMTKFYSFTYAELEEKVYGYLSDYISFLNIFETLRVNRNLSIEKLEFPFPYFRDGQLEMMNLVDETIKNGEISFIEAATGIGKTVATIYPSLKYIKDDKIDKYFYLTAKNSGFEAPLALFRNLEEKGLETKVITITGKDKMCMNTGKQCNPEACIFARGYFNKIRSVLKKSLLNHNIFDENLIKDIAFEAKVCPFELSLDLSLYCDYIICDYNYAFHPTAQLKRYFDSPDKDYRSFFFIDEAHNLISRSRDMYSAYITYKAFKDAYDILITEGNKDIKELMKELKKDYDQFKTFIMVDPDDESKIINDISLENVDENFISHLKKYVEAYMNFLASRPKFYSEECENFSIEVYKFLKIFEMTTENFQIYLHRDSKESENYYFKIFCLDASDYIKATIDQVSGAAMFSATFTPFDYYEKLIINRSPDHEISIDSPFDPNKFNLMVNTTTSLLYKDRMKTLFTVIDLIDTFVSKTIGNYLIFLPSYEYLNAIKQNLLQDPNKKYIFQSKNMSNKEKRHFIEEFKLRPRKSLVAFTVLGGNFNEGIDLVEDRLRGVCVVGVGLPSFDYENNLLKEYYDKNGYKGYDYAYINPGINHVMQAVGRLIRTENDFGSALLIDTRYSYSAYKTLFKKEWKNYKVVKNSQELEKLLEDFDKNWYNR